MHYHFVSTVSKYPIIRNEFDAYKFEHFELVWVYLQDCATTQFIELEQLTDTVFR